MENLHLEQWRYKKDWFELEILGNLQEFMAIIHLKKTKINDQVLKAYALRWYNRKNLVSLIQNFNQKTPYLDSCTKKPFVILEKLILTCILSLGGHYWPVFLLVILTCEAMDHLINQNNIQVLNYISKVKL
jgi:hypothetical protein